jgi:hypothetical protein
MSHAFHTYLKDWDDTVKHIRYIAFRSREHYDDQTKGVFSEREDKADVETFIHSLKQSKSLKAHSAAKIHRILFTMSRDEWERSEFEHGDYQRVVRNVMKNFEIKKGYRLEWVAAEHRKEENPHVHCVIKGTYKDKDGIERRLRITSEDKDLLIREFKEELDRIRGFELPDREYEKQFNRYNDPIFQKPMDMTLLDSILYEIDRRLEEEKRARDKAQDKSRSR